MNVLVGITGADAPPPVAENNVPIAWWSNVITTSVHAWCRLNYIADVVNFNYGIFVELPINFDYKMYDYHFHLYSLYYGASPYTRSMLRGTLDQFKRIHRDHPGLRYIITAPAHVNPLYEDISVIWFSFVKSVPRQTITIYNGRPGHEFQKMTIDCYELMIESCIKRTIHASSGYVSIVDPTDGCLYQLCIIYEYADEYTRGHIQEWNNKRRVNDPTGQTHPLSFPPYFGTLEKSKWPINELKWYLQECPHLSDVSISLFTIRDNPFANETFVERLRTDIHREFDTILETFMYPWQVALIVSGEPSDDVTYDDV